MTNTVTTTTTTLETILNSLSTYSGGRYDRINKASQVLTCIAWQEYPSKAFNNLVDVLTGFNQEVADTFAKNGVGFTVLWNDKTCASGHYKDGIQVDTEEWYIDLPKYFIKELQEDDKVWSEIQELIENFAGDVQKEIQKYLKINDISDFDLDELV
jgi:hypothetical protein